MILDKIKSLFGIKPKSGGAKGGAGTYTGVIKKFQYKKGFGFISSPELDSEVFVHYSDANFKMREGNEVSFNIQDTEKGPRAVDVNFIAKGKAPRRSKNRQ